jgi:hypothetical protein
MRPLSRSTLIATVLAIVGLTLVVVVLATSNTTAVTPAAHHTESATGATPAAETGARLDHSGRKLQLENQLTRTYLFLGHH